MITKDINYWCLRRQSVPKRGQTASAETASAARRAHRGVESPKTFRFPTYAGGRWRLPPRCLPSTSLRIGDDEGTRRDRHSNQICTR